MDNIKNKFKEICTNILRNNEKYDIIIDLNYLNDNIYTKLYIAFKIIIFEINTSYKKKGKMRFTLRDITGKTISDYIFY